MRFDTKITNNTLVDLPRLEMLDLFLDQTKDVVGDIAEIGVYKGGTARLLVSSTNKKVYLFDTFEGMPPVTKYDLHKQGDFADTSLGRVDELLNEFSNYSLYKGIFPIENSVYVAHKKFSLVHLDVDIYSSVGECLGFFYPRMSRGGIIVLDDYNEPNCPGAKLATDEFCKLIPYKVQPTTQSQAYILIE